MSELLNSYVFWAILLVVSVPMMIILLNEVIDRLRRRQSRYLASVTSVRDVLFPMIVLLVLLRLVFTVEQDNLTAKLLSTVFWVSLIIVTYRFSRVVIGSGEHSPDNWRSYVPHMFLRLPPYTIIGVIIFHVIQNLWALPVKELATTLGIGSIVVAFALQDTLSNLVSGLLLVANSPFKTGDWIHVGDIEGKIVAVNWRYTNIETWSGDLVVIPNGSIAGKSIENHSRPRKPTALTQRLEFSFESPPNAIKEMLLETLLRTPGVLEDPAPCASVVEFSDPVMVYEVEFWIQDYANKPEVHDNFMTRLWYATQRHEITLPTPTYELHTGDGNVDGKERVATAVERIRLLDLFAHFARLPADAKELIGEHSTLKHYGKNERIVEIKAKESGLYLVFSGIVTLSLPDADGEPRIIERLVSRGIFGETGLTGRAISPITATVLEDAKVLVVPHKLMNDVINNNAGFADEISTLISRRRAAEKRIEAEKESAPVVVLAVDSARAEG